MIISSFIADLSGPDFLKLYCGVIVVVILSFITIRFIIMNLNNNTTNVTHSTELKAYEVAYLRGGAKELLNLVIFNLINKKLIIASKGTTIRIKAKHNISNIKLLDTLENKVLRMMPVKYSIALKDLRRETTLVHDVEDYIEFKDKLRKQGLLLSEGYRTFIRYLKAILITLVVGLGAYKLVIAVSKGYTNVFFLILFAVIGIILLANFGIPRLTNRGKVYLKYLQNTYAVAKDSINERLKNKVVLDGSETYTENGDLLLGIYGLSLLTATDEFSAFGEEFSKDNDSWYSGGIGSCGGAGFSCGGGSSCGGGGCGGCGGCGG